MSQPNRIAFIGNSLPRRCGIATFTTDLERSIALAGDEVETTIVALTDLGSVYDYPATVGFEIVEERIEDYIRAAEFLNSRPIDVVCLQHEYGIFGGEAGDHILTLLSRLTAPIVTTFHTVLETPSPSQRSVLRAIAKVSASVVVMAEKGRELLHTVYQVPADKIEVIPHGVPDRPFVAPDAAKARLGFAGRPVILTFGLLSPNKGIEVMIEAMPAILRDSPDAAYVVLGATHPQLIRQQGEAYRERLIARARELGIEGHVEFLDRFVDQETLLGFIAMCDLYVTPYLNKAQMTSGTLSYSFGLGKAVVSTPYWHARELLADGRGVLVPFGDAAALGREISALLTDADRREALRRRAYSSSRSMTWDRVSRRYMSLFTKARRHQFEVVSPLSRPAPAIVSRSLPAMSLTHFSAMCDDTGLFQHAVHSVPDRAHGYCVDDNARALLLARVLNRPGEQPLADDLTGRFAAFVQHAWNPDTRRFRNFMSFDRRWLEDRGSEDSHGRTLWALGECALGDATSSRRKWATGLFAAALPPVQGFTSPRAWAFALLGLDAYCSSAAGDVEAERLRLDLAARLMALLAAVESDEWAWFEEGLSYDNARLCEALIVTGIATERPDYLTAGLRTLRWLMTVQTAPKGHFRPVGTDGFGSRRSVPDAFDQQPVEAAATIAACLAAWRADEGMSWKIEAQRAFAWFQGANDLALPLVDIVTGSCRDGLHPDRANENRGAESVLAYLLSLADMRAIMLHRQDRAQLALA